MTTGLDHDAASVRRHWIDLLVMFAIVVAAAAITMASFDRPPAHLYPAPDGQPVTPLGYTYSLVLFLFPVAAMAVWFFRHRERFRPHAAAFVLTARVIVPLWILLDILLAHSFFRFPNEAAHLQWLLPGYHPETGWGMNIPIEEFIFYISGNFVIVLCYIWADEEWFSAYAVPEAEYEREAREVQRAALFHPTALLLGVGAFAAAFAWKKLVSDVPEGFPGYFLFLLTLVIVPTAMFQRVVGRFVNQRAFLFTIVALLFISLVWEVTLALPAGWWDYHPEMMTGIFLTPWSNLPLEAALLWAAAGWSNVILFELFRLVQHTDRSLKHLVLGR